MNIAEGLKPLIVPIASVRADPQNARIHDDRNLEAIKKSLETYGQRKPIVVNHDGIIEAGSGLYEAAKELGWKKIAAVMVKDDGDHAKGFALMDNQSATLADWSLPGLKDLLEELDHGAFDMDATGFSESEREDLLGMAYEPHNIEDLLEEIDLSQATDKPLWIVIRTTPEKQEILESALALLEREGIRVERSYGT